MRIRIALLVVFAALSAACGGAPDAPSGEPELADRPLIDDETGRGPGPSSPTPAAPSSAPASGAACEIRTADAWAPSPSCVPEGPGEVVCAQPSRSGVVYACRDGGESPRRPALAGCIEYGHHDDPFFGESWSLVLCPQAACVPFDAEAAACGEGERAVACPGDDAAAPPSAGCHEVRSWSDGRASGPLYCCPR